MSGRVLDAIKFSLLGGVVGGVVGYAGDLAVSGLGSALRLSMPAGDTASVLASASVAVVVSSATVAVVLYGGEQLMQTMGADADPLAGMVFYLSAYSAMGSAQTAPRIVAGFLRQLTMSASSPPQKGPSIDPPANSGCQRPGGCGGLSL